MRSPNVVLPFLLGAISLVLPTSQARAIDESASRPWDPRHDHTRNVPIVSGEVNEYAIALSHTANLFRAGHRLEIEISSMDTVPGGLHICSSKTTMHHIYHDHEHASYVLLPVIPTE